jgi:hypothetical protein
VTLDRRRVAVGEKIELTATAHDATAATSQPVEAVFIDGGTDGRDLGDLVSHRVEVFSLERGAAASVVRRLDLENFAELLGRDECTGVALVTWLAATTPPRRRWRRSPLGFYSGGIGGGRLRGVGRVQVELLHSSAIRVSNEAMTATMAAWASGGTVLQSESRIEG